MKTSVSKPVSDDELHELAYVSAVRRLFRLGSKPVLRTMRNSWVYKETTRRPEHADVGSTYCDIYILAVEPGNRKSAVIEVGRLKSNRKLETISVTY